MVYALGKVLIGIAIAPIGSCWLLPRLQSATFVGREATAAASTATLLFAEKDAEEHRTDPPTTAAQDELFMPNSSVNISSPVLRQVYPDLMEHVKEYGNPNIPLGSSAGRQCETLRRLRTQNKLTDDEVELLTDLGFRWHDLEDVYRTADFDDLLQRLLNYRDENDGNLSPPKKYNLDPELGAWVTGIRRLGPEQVDPEHRDKLDAVGFSWVSQRKCGSSFMKQYRSIAKQLQQDGADPKDIWVEEGNRKWIRAQQMANQRKDLSETRQHYLEHLLGPDWAEVEF